MTLTEFLTARWDEREALALAVMSKGPWSATGHPESPLVWANLYDESTADLVAEDLWRDDAVFITANDPAFVLADVAAKRAIVERAILLNEQADSLPDDHSNKHAFEGQALAWRLAARLLAQPYAAHPDFDPAWKVNP